MDRPDRVALWAVLMGVGLMLIAATSGKAATCAETARVDRGPSLRQLGPHSGPRLSGPIALAAP
jgi:hypothetical protein